MFAMDRRDFGKLLAFGGLAAVSPAIGAQTTVRPGHRSVIKPAKLKAGDTVGMVAPASMAFEADAITMAKEQVEALGFKVRLGEHVFDKHGYFAGTDESRAGDINRMFADDSIDAIFFYTGGWGTPRLLPLLDYALIRRNPKVILGYSDITALLNGIHQETGLITFHGPVAASNMQAWSVDNLKRTLMSSDPIGVLSNPPKDTDALVERTFRLITIRGGSASGRLVGGNLTLLSVMMGTPWEIDTEGAILLLEDTHEKLYRVDRMITQLRLGGKLKQAAGIVFGYCTDCPVEGPSFSLEEILRDHMEPLGIPVLSGLAFGHIRKMLTLPIGLEATLDADAGTLTIDESAVV